jgi:hypothetical protein
MIVAVSLHCKFRNVAGYYFYYRGDFFKFHVQKPNFHYFSLLYLNILEHIHRFSHCLQFYFRGQAFTLFLRTAYCWRWSADSIAAQPIADLRKKYYLFELELARVHSKILVSLTLWAKQTQGISMNFCGSDSRGN